MGYELGHCCSRCYRSFCRQQVVALHLRGRVRPSLFEYVLAFILVGILVATALLLFGQNVGEPFSTINTSLTCV